MTFFLFFLEDSGLVWDCADDEYSQTRWGGKPMVVARCISAMVCI